MSGDLFGQAVPTEVLLSPHLRLERVPSDTMEPTLRGGWDYVLVRPCTKYEGEGIYLVGNPFGSWDLRRASNVLGGREQIRLTVDNKHYGDRLVSADWFDENVLALVVADVKIRDQRLLEATCRHGRAA
ncbi:hypothetical protein [Ancylobacter sp. SL191]|uniref:hypothetical protein n=1 Tax=Ancylobacter sp. SL191 TaxID=2995166 RepID=UPI00226E0671|nr:hypothetical protein [Ancylobacter sp. SL191]WAC29249.1 hypothetical protein OU996_09580 [Ancylobacter sp. SL191]